MGDGRRYWADVEAEQNTPEWLKKRVKELEDKLRAAEAALADIKEQQRVLPYAPNAESVSRGLVVGSTVRLSNGVLGVVVAYDAEGDPLIQGPRLREDGDTEAALASALELVLPPKERK